MTRIERAKQFMPFSPLKGYSELLTEYSVIKSEKLELSEEQINDINFVLSQINKKDIVKVVYYSENSYKEIAGIVSELNVVNETIKIIKTNIKFEDIYSIEIKN